MTVPTRLVSFRTVLLPSQDPAQIAKLVSYQVTRFSSLPASDVAAAGYVSAAGSVAPYPTLVAWTRRENVTGAGGPGPAPDHAQPIPTALYCFARAFGPFSPGEKGGIVDVGHTATTVVLFQHDRILFARECRIGLKDFVRAVSRGLDVSETVASERLRQDGGIGPGSPVGRYVITTVVRLVAEIEASCQQVHFVDSPVLVRPDRILLVGGGSTVPGLSEAIAAHLSIRVEPLGPAVHGLSAAEAPLLAPAIGAAVAPFADHRVNLDLAEGAAGAWKLRPGDVPLRPTSVFAMSLILLTLMCWYELTQVRGAVVRAQAQMSRVWTGTEKEAPALRELIRNLERVRSTFAAGRTLAALEALLRGDAEEAFARGVVVHELRLDREGNVTLSGTARSSESVAQVLRKLDSSGLFQGSSLLGTEIGDTDQTVRFRLATVASDALRP
ncbi:MAG: pilus assembly protein PilM [Candidatus Riflebacteria bacterium]|nr:pilus assembly protein PilM [Candidatus Riflebacteria bacterium]